MSGHSKWATIKHKKGATDAKRAKVFAKLIRQVEVAAREGGPDPEMNPSLRTMFQKARDSSVPLDTIEKAIKRATGGLDGVNYEQITYEGYAAGGVALLIEVLTDPTMIRISDSGPGVPLNEREAVFERFVRGRLATGDGTGLGLAIARDIAALHGATVILGDAAWGGGTSVTISFAN